jgi:HEAT repeat protein
MFMNDPDEHLRRATVYALGALEDRESVSALSLVPRDSKPWVRWNGAWSLLEFGKALRSVASRIKDEDTEVRLFVANARERLQNENPSADVHADHRLWVVQQGRGCLTP